MKGDTTPYFRQNLTGAYTPTPYVEAAREYIKSKALQDADLIMAALGIEEL